MPGCPYTWFVGLFSKSGSSGGSSPNSIAQYLRVTVDKCSERIVDVALPAGSARWLIELIPNDVVDKIRAEGIPLDSIQDELAQRPILNPQEIFTLKEPERVVNVWLE